MAVGRILVVEDNPDNLKLLEEVLYALDYEVLTAYDGEQGLKVARAEHPDLIIMDLSLPRLDGWEATRQLKADATMRDTPVIALTAHAMMGDRERALDAGCDDYLTKPVNLRDLARAVGRYIRS